MTSDYVQSFDSTRPVYLIKFLLLQTIRIEDSLYCCDKLANFGTNMHKPEFKQLVNLVVI